MNQGGIQVELAKEEKEGLLWMSSVALFPEPSDWFANMDFVQVTIHESARPSKEIAGGDECLPCELVWCCCGLP